MPPDVTVIDAVVAPVLQCTFVPAAVNIELPQLFAMVTSGASGIILGDAVPLPGILVHPPAVCVTV